MAKAKMIVHTARRFLYLHTTVTTNDDIFSYVTEAEMTVHIGLLNLYSASASTPYKLTFFSFLMLAIKKNLQWKRTSMIANIILGFLCYLFHTSSLSLYERELV